MKLNFWPFNRNEKIETRSEQPYSDIILNALTAQAAGTSGGNALTIAAVEAAAGQYARAFAGCEVKASERIKEALTPSLLSLIARNLIRYGESVHVIEVKQGDVTLIPAGSWNVTGSWNEEEWVYEIHVNGPSGTVSSYEPSSGVVHCRYAYDSARPWNGISPIGFCTSTGTLAANLETKLGQETSGPVGYVFPIPIDSAPKTDGTGALDTLRRDLNNLKGQSVLIETTSAGWGEGKGSAPQKDGASERIGANPPEV